MDEKALTSDTMEELKKEIRSEISAAVDKAYQEEPISGDIQRELEDIYNYHEQTLIAPQSGKSTERRFVDAISDGLKQSMGKYPELVLMGQDIGDYGGVFKITEGFIDLFGRERVRNTLT